MSTPVAPLLAALCIGALLGAYAWERARSRLVALSELNAGSDRHALEDELRKSRELALARADAAERNAAERVAAAELRMREVEHSLLELRAREAGATPPPPPMGKPAPELPLELMRELASIEEPEARVELEAHARELLESGHAASAVVSALFGAR